LKYMNWKKLTLAGSVALATIAISAIPMQAQGRGHSGGGGGRGASAGAGMHAGRSGNFGSARSNHGGNNWNHGGNHWGHGGHHGHHWRSGIYFGGFGYPYYDGFYPYGGYGYPYYGSTAYYNGYYDGRVYNGRLADSSGGSVVADVQQELARSGYYRGAIDGVIGSQTRGAIRAYERRNGLRVDGRIDSELLDSLGVG
jgi:Putative peptidoglycan binding domain